MNTYMICKDSFFAKGNITHTTLERECVTMSLFMTPKATARLEGSTACITFERVIISMRMYMIAKESFLERVRITLENGGVTMSLYMILEMS